MKYEIVNPSDPYTMEAEDIRVAAIVAVWLGSGQYSLKALEDGAEGVPFFMFGGFEQWWDARCSLTTDAFSEARGPELIAALDSVTLGSEKRSSMNDIGGRAKEWAQVLRAKQKDGPKAPQQVFAS